MTHTINPNVKEIWLNAMRSSRYRKGQGSLFNAFNSTTLEADFENPRHCALGVLCEEAAKLGIIEIDSESWGSKRFFKDIDIPHDHLVPEAVREWADLGNFEDVEAPVAKMNDNSPNKTTFEDIADYIEEHF